MEFRQATEADFLDEYQVFVAAQAELHTRHSIEWSPAPFESFAAVQRHLLVHDSERSFVAEEGGRIAGFSAAFARGEVWYFSSLFVDPEFQSRGVGRELLDLSWGTGYSRRITITEAIQPVSTGLYAKRGLVPVTPVLIFAGAPRIKLVGGLTPAPADRTLLQELDLAAYGFDRTVDHEYWAARPAQATLWLENGEPVAYSYVTTEGIVGPVAGLDGSRAARALEAELARARGNVMAFVVGSADELARTALAAGLRLSGPPGLLLSDPAWHPATFTISSFFLL